MTNRPAPVSLEQADLALLRQGTWNSGPKDRRCLRLSRLRLCESVAMFKGDDGTDKIRWRTTDKGALLLSQSRIVR